MENGNPTHCFRETNFVCFSSYKNRKLKSKAVVSWSSQKKKEDTFYTVQFVQRKLFLAFLCYLNVQGIEYTFIIYIHYISKKITLYNFLLVYKIVESLQFILKKKRHQFQCSAEISFLEVCKQKNQTFLTCECLFYHGHELCLDL